MSLRTFSAKTMPEALALVRRDLGSDAVVLHTRAYKRGGVLGFGAKTVVEITAMSGRDLAKRRQGRARTQTPKKQAKTQAGKSTQALTSSSPSSTGEALAGDLIRRTYAAAQAEMRGSAEAFPAETPPQSGRSGGGMAAVHPRALSRAGSPKVALVSPPEGSVDTSDRFAEELAAVRALVQRVAERQDAEAERIATQAERSAARSAAAASGFEVPDDLVDFYTRMIQDELAEELAQRVVQEADGAEGDVGARDASVRRQLAALMPTDSGAASVDAVSAGRARVVALVGPTGVGKTTTVAKLAATYKLKQGKKVGVVTLDTYRIAAVDQLKTYCSIIGCPLEVAHRPAELKACLSKLADCDVVLIDTAGRSQRDDEKLEELSDFLAAAEPDETHLVLAATASERVMLQIAERFGRVDPDRVIFTKLDEAVTCGTLFNVVAKIGKKLSFVTTGQEVPHQIEPGDASRLAERVLGRCSDGGEAGPVGVI